MHSSSLLSWVLVAFASVGSTSASALVTRQDTTARTTPLLQNFGGIPPLPTLSQVQATNASGTALNLADIQGDILVGQKKPVENFVFFKITNPSLFKKTMKALVVPLITSTAQLIGPANKQPLAFVNVAFSQSGLTALGIHDDLGDPLFTAGQFADAAALLDDTDDWEPAFKGTSIHGVFLVGSDKSQLIDLALLPIVAALAPSTSIVFELKGSTRPGNQAGHEHFGYLDGISNPGIQGFTVNPFPGQSLVPTGVILAGEQGDTIARPAWAKDGAFLAFRKLHQLVPEFKNFLQQNAVEDQARNLTKQQGADLLGARMIGRWPSGAPVDLSPLQDNPALGADPQRNNNFDFTHPGTDNHTDQSICPFTAHVRKVRPRGDLVPANTLNQAIRSSITFGPEVTPAEMSSGKTTLDRGVAFVMYQSNLANGFHFLQSIWANNPGFIFGKNITTVGQDLIIGQSGNLATRSNTGMDPINFNRQITMNQVVVSNGGEYFFSPTISALKNTILA